MLEWLSAESHRTEWQRWKRLIIGFHNYISIRRKTWRISLSICKAAKGLSTLRQWYWTTVVGVQCYFPPFVLHSGISLGSLLQTLASICVKLIGQRRGRGMKPELLFGDHLGHQASDFPWEDESTSPSHLIHTTLTLLFLLSAPMNWSFYAMLRNFLMIALPLFEVFVWARWGGYHLARQLALFPGRQPLPWGSVTEQQVPFLSCVCPFPVLKSHNTAVVGPFLQIISLHSKILIPHFF